MTKVQWASKEAIDRYLDVVGCKTKEEVKWTRVVLCSAHWSKQPTMVEVDLPDIKFTTRARQSETKWHWNCAATLCNNSWRTEQNGASTLEYYNLSDVEKDKTLKNAYDKILKNKKVSPIKIGLIVCLKLSWYILNNLNQRTFLDFICFIQVDYLESLIFLKTRTAA